MRHAEIVKKVTKYLEKVESFCRILYMKDFSILEIAQAQNEDVMSIGNDYLRAGNGDLEQIIFYL
jgi:hypothetical protein